ncbi:hypothetical protein AAEO56_06965 [Flavobacterium sp. DGU11]|uniref:DUF5723 domain-containing protein n=1 Tax=Flavobacterium arundinis TaxID=3139143 RepID=A0ABU9HWU9_9FLAO
MNKKKSLFCILSIFAFFGVNMSAQDIITDNKGKPIFNMPTSLIAPKLTANSGGIRFPIKRYNGTNYFYYQNNDSSKPKKFTVRKSWSIFGNIEVVSNTASILDLSKKPNVSPHFEIGIGNTLDSIYTNVSDLEDWYQTFSAAVFIDYQHFKVYDTLTQTTDKFRRWSPGIKVTYNRFKKDLYGLAFTGSYQKNVNVSALTSYQNITGTFYTDPNVAGNGTVDGYFAPAKVANQFRFSIAAPIFCIPPILIKGAQFMPAPYFFITTPDFGKIERFGGITLNILPTRIYKSAAKAFAITSAFSAGYNIWDSATKDSQGYFFFSGSFSFGDLKPATKEKNIK